MSGLLGRGTSPGTPGASVKPLSTRPDWSTRCKATTRATRWDLVRNRRALMTEVGLKLEWEWEAAPTVQAPEHRATWARVEIRAGDQWATLVEDRASGSARRSIYCPLYP